MNKISILINSLYPSLNNEIKKNILLLCENNQQIENSICQLIEHIYKINEFDKKNIIKQIEQKLNLTGINFNIKY